MHSSAVAELQHFLSQSSSPSVTSPAAVHAQFQVLRDSGDAQHWFLRSILELTSSPEPTLSPQNEELLFHCITGCRHVLLAKWNVTSKVLSARIRDFLWSIGIWGRMNDGCNSTQAQSSISRATRMAALNASASFWKRSWVEDGKPLQQQQQQQTFSPQEQSLIHQIEQSWREGSGRPNTLPHFQSPMDLFQHLEQLLVTTTANSTVGQMATSNFNNLNNNHGKETAEFLSILVGEFAGKSASQYHLPLEFHKQAHLAFEKGLSSTTGNPNNQNPSQVNQADTWVPLNHCLNISMQVLGQLVQLDHSSENKYTDDMTLAVVQLVIDIISWERGTDAWEINGSSLGGEGKVLVRPPTQWRETLLQPDFVKAIFHVHQTKLQSGHGSTTTSQVLHALRQLLLLMASLTGSIFQSDYERKHFAALLVEGTLQLLQTPNIASAEDALLVDSLSMVSRLFFSFKLSTLGNLPQLQHLLQEFAGIGHKLLQDHWQESQQTAGDLELMENRDWREEALRLMMDGVAHLCTDPWLLYSGTEDTRQAARSILARSLGPLYVSFVTCRTQMSRLEEMYYLAHETELDEVREEISAVDLEEEMTSLASIGRLDLAESLKCLSNLFNNLIPRIQSFWDGPGGHVTPEAAGLLEESRLVTMYVGHLLTDDSQGETPVIPDTVLAACKQSSQTVAALVTAVETLQHFAQFQATKIAANATDLRLSPLLAKEFLWFFQRWAPAYILPVDYGSTGDSNMLVKTWSTPEKVQETASFVITLCVHYFCYWPQERQVQVNASQLLHALSRRCPQMRSAMVATTAFRELLTYHCLSAGIRHSASQAEFEATIQEKAGNVNVHMNMIRGYQRLPYDIKSKIVSGLLVGCSEYADDLSRKLFEDCLAAIHGAFSSLVQSLVSKQINSADLDAREMAGVCVELYGGVARAGDMVASERIPKFLTPSLPHLSGLMAFYAEDLSICESLLRLFRDYAEQFIATLESGPCIALFQASGDLLKSYSSVHCASTRVVMHSVEEEQNYNDILCAIQLLIQLGTKDFIDAGNGSGGGIDSNQVTDMIFFGLQQILPLMTRGLLQYPTLCTQYFSLVGFMMETYPGKVSVIPYELFDSLLESLAFGMSHHDTSVAKSSLQGITGIAKEHLQHKVLDIHLAKNPELLDRCSRRLLLEVIFQSCVWDRIEAAGTALLLLAAIDLNRFATVVQDISRQIPAEQQSRLTCSFENLLQQETLSNALAGGYEGRQKRIRFKKDFEGFCHDIHSFLVLK